MLFLTQIDYTDPLYTSSLTTWAAVLGAVATVATGLITYFATKTAAMRENDSLHHSLHLLTKERDRKEAEFEKLRSQFGDANSLAKRYTDIRSALQKSSVVKRYYQPVLIVGPRAVGKTSLLMQWHAPWTHGRLEGTTDVWSAEVPIFDYTESEAEPHFADASILTAVRAHLILKVFDFPGELSAQRRARDIAIQESKLLNKHGRTRLGIVLICMLDALEAQHGISAETHQYYNGDLFRELFTLNMHNDVFVERIILVFNKYDLLREAVGRRDDDERLLEHCLERFRQIYAPLYRICNPERICATFTVLNREAMREKNRGAPIVLGEAARHFVSAFAGSTVAETIIKDGGTPLPPSTSPGF